MSALTTEQTAIRDPLAKLEVTSRTQAALVAVEEGIAEEA